MKNKKLKSINYESEDTKEIKNLIFIIIGITIIAVGLYYLTARKLNKTTSEEFDYKFLYSTADNNASTYKSLINTYSQKEDALKIYSVDLNANLDNKYLSEISNSNPTNPDEVKIKDSALVLIKDGKVSAYYEKLSDYQEVLK